MNLRWEKLPKPRWMSTRESASMQSLAPDTVGVASTAKSMRPPPPEQLSISPRDGRRAADAISA
jgi:hypothetical protein